MNGGRLFLVTLVVRDYDEAIDWFVRALDFELVEDTPQGGGKRWVVVRGDGGAALLLARAADATQEAAIGNQAGGRVAFFLETSNFATRYKRMVENGVRFVREPVAEPYGTVAVFEDICGNHWDLIERTG
jgi:catechol 2,3-dioxygenase-like lactoylglutathione lyase family enzyme